MRQEQNPNNMALLRRGIASEVVLNASYLCLLAKTVLLKSHLDFTGDFICVIDPFTLQKIGFELSPWSSHRHPAGFFMR
jgi:hypothetical protein